MEQQSIIQEARNDRDRAIMEAKTYRDLAEKIKKEQREQECNLLKQTEAVRDFWRNKVLEGDIYERRKNPSGIVITSIIIICQINNIFATPSVNYTCIYNDTRWHNLVHLEFPSELVHTCACSVFQRAQDLVHSAFPKVVHPLYT